MPSKIITKIAKSAKEFENVKEVPCELPWFHDVDKLHIKDSICHMVEPFIFEELESIRDVVIDGQDFPLVEFVDENSNQKLMSMVLDKNQIAKRCFFVNLSNYCGSTELVGNIKSRRDAAVALLQGYFSQDGALEEIKKCLNHSSLLSIHGSDMMNVTVCVCAISFVATREGLYVNWFATSKALFNKTVWSKGDDECFTRRGIGSLAIQIMWQIAGCLSQRFAIKLRIMLQVQTDETEAIEFYRNRGFWICKGIERQQMPGDCVNLFEKESRPQCMHWIDSAGNVALATLHSPPHRDKGNRVQILSTNSLLLMSPSSPFGKMSSRRRHHNRIHSNIELNELRDKVYFEGQKKGEKMAKDFKVFHAKLVKSLKLNEEEHKDGQKIIAMFPPRMAVLHRKMEECCKGVDASHFFDPPELAFDDFDNQKTDDLRHLMKINIQIQSFSLLFPTVWVKEHVIDLMVTYLLRDYRKTKDFFYWCNGVLGRLMETTNNNNAKITKERNNSKIDAEFLTLYRSLVNNKMKGFLKPSPMFKAKYWLVPKFNVCHFQVMFVVRPIHLFEPPATAAEGPVMLYSDSLGGGEMFTTNELKLLGNFCKFAYMQEHKSKTLDVDGTKVFLNCKKNV